jgi:hypothetical protein
MPVDSGDRDYYSPEEKQRIHEEWLNSERGQRFQKGMEWEERKASVVRAVVWIIVGLLALVVGSAVVKWAIEELAK